jgi:hypothetical protein
MRFVSGGNEDDQGEVTVSDSDLDGIIGVSDSSALEVVQQEIVSLSFNNQLIVLTLVVL